MRVNNVITKMKAGQKAYGCSLTFPSTAVVELMGQAGLEAEARHVAAGNIVKIGGNKRERHRLCAVLSGA